LGINKDPVTIELIEKEIGGRAYDMGFVKPGTNIQGTGKRVAVIGSGPAGLAAADQLNLAGHKVTLFDKDNKVGGLLRYGIPDFQLEKWVIDRRVAVQEEEVVMFATGTEIGSSIRAEEILRQFDAVVLATGAQQPRDLKI